jgi:hypothetical protein
MEFNSVSQDFEAFQKMWAWFKPLIEAEEELKNQNRIKKPEQNPGFF